MELKSKVMKRLSLLLYEMEEKPMQSFIESQIRAAIREFAEMATKGRTLIPLDGTVSFLIGMDELRELLAAFGIEDK
jgi:hypothetical protein